MISFLDPLGVVCYYALTDPSTGEFSLVNLRGLNLYWGVLWQSIFYAVASPPRYGRQANSVLSDRFCVLI